MESVFDSPEQNLKKGRLDALVKQKIEKLEQQKRLVDRANEILTRPDVSAR
jgi:hypothetical protein